MLALYSNNNFDTIGRAEMEKIIKPDSKVLCFSGADLEWQLDNPEELLQGGNYYSEQYAPFKSFGITTDHFYIVSPKDDKETIKSRFIYCDIVFLAGGRMCVLQDLLNQFDLWNLIKMYDKHIIGVSAGALIQLEKYDITPYIDDDYDYYDTCKGLGLVKDLRLIVHYNNERKEHQEILQYLTDLVIDEMCETNKDIMVVALSDNEGIIIDNDKNYELKVFGRDD